MFRTAFLWLVMATVASGQLASDVVSAIHGENAGQAFRRLNSTIGTMFSTMPGTLDSSFAMTERGRYALRVQVQNFDGDSLDGANLGQFEALFRSERTGNLVASRNAVDYRMARSVAVVACGISSRLDIAVAVPLVRSRLDVTSDSGFLGADATYVKQPRLRNGTQSSGLGDIEFRVKGTAFQRGRAALLTGVDLRGPTGDERKLLGIGAPGVRPFAAAVLRGRIEPRFSLGYQINGKSGLGYVPNHVTYTAGMSLSAVRRVSGDLEVVGHRLRNASRGVNLTSVRAGVRVVFARRLEAAASLMRSLDRGGLRDNFVPIFGLAYSF